jgi:hypothetical protein
VKKDRIMIKEIQKVEVEQEVIAVIKKEIEDQELKAVFTFIFFT